MPGSKNSVIVAGCPAIVQGDVIHPIERANELAELYRHMVAVAPDQLMMSLEFRVATEYPPFAPSMSGRPLVVIEVTHCGPVEEADRHIRALRASKPIIDTVQPRSFLAVQTRKDETLAWGHRFYMKNAFFPAITDQIVDLCASRICDAS